MSYNWDTNEFDYDVINDETYIPFGEENADEVDAEFEAELEASLEYDDDEPVTGYAFVRQTVEGDDDEITQNSKIIVTDYLPDVLRAFEDFLRDAGFTYVRSLGAECEGGNVTWSSAD